MFRIQAISLGQGQGPVAEKLIATATQSGDWVFLQVDFDQSFYCHLTKSLSDVVIIVMAR